MVTLSKKSETSYKRCKKCWGTWLWSHSQELLDKFSTCPLHLQIFNNNDAHCHLINDSIISTLNQQSILSTSRTRCPLTFSVLFEEFVTLIICWHMLSTYYLSNHVHCLWIQTKFNELSLFSHSTENVILPEKMFPGNWHMLKVRIPTIEPAYCEHD